MKQMLFFLLVLGWVGSEFRWYQEDNIFPGDSSDRVWFEDAPTRDNNAAKDEKRLVHLVWFKLKPTTDKTRFIDQLKQLEQIEEVHDFEVGQFADLKDPRAMSDFQMAMQMGFKNERDYKIYQSHPIHVKLKTQLGDYVSGPPVTYDYWSQ